MFRIVFSLHSHAFPVHINPLCCSKFTTTRCLHPKTPRKFFFHVPSNQKPGFTGVFRCGAPGGRSGSSPGQPSRPQHGTRPSPGNAPARSFGGNRTATVGSFVTPKKDVENNHGNNVGKSQIYPKSVRKKMWERVKLPLLSLFTEGLDVEKWFITTLRRFFFKFIILRVSVVKVAHKTLGGLVNDGDVTSDGEALLTNVWT